MYNGKERRRYPRGSAATPERLRAIRQQERAAILERLRVPTKDLQIFVPLASVSRASVETLIADCLIRYQNVISFARHHWRDQKLYAKLRVRNGKAVIPKALQMIRDLPAEKDRVGLNQMISWSENRAKVGLSLRKFNKQALDELIMSLVATFRCLVQKGETSHALGCAAVVLDAAGIVTERGDRWELDAIHQRICRTGGVKKLEKVGKAIISTEKRTGTPLVQAQGRYYRGYSPQ